MGTSDRRPYLTATTLNQAFLDQCQDNLENCLEMIADIETPNGTIHASDRNKYVGSTFYRAMTKFPVIKRTVGDWLSPELEFSSLTISLSNVDGSLNKYLPAGADFGGWIGKTIEVKVGLRDVASTYETIFKGSVTEIGGFSRDVGTLTLIARDQFDALNTDFPTAYLSKDLFPDISPDIAGTIAPIIYGDWTIATNNDRASIPCIPVNTNNPLVVGRQADDTVSPPVEEILAGQEKLQLVIAGNDLAVLDTSHVFLRRGDLFYRMDSADIVDVLSGNRGFSVLQGLTTPTASTMIDSEPYTWQSGDQFYVRCVGKDLGSGPASSNIVLITKDILKTFGGLSDANFDANWGVFAAKSSPAQDNIAGIGARVWIQEPQKLMSYAASLLEQVRLEPFLSRSLKLKLNSMQFSNFVAAPGFTVRNWDLQRGSFKPQADERNQWNRARAEYCFDPLANANNRATSIFKNQGAIDQAGKAISKKVVFPNLYEEDKVEIQLSEMLKLASGYAEYCEMSLTTRALLLDIGDFVLLNVQIGSTIFQNVPAMIRELSFDPSGKIPIKALSMQMLPFSGWNPGYTGIKGGYQAVITKES